MNSFVKKMAIAMSGVLAVGVISAAPAQAAPMTVAVTASIAGSGTAASPYTVNVPADNTVNTTSGANAEVLTLTATVDAGSSVTFGASNAKITQTTGTSVFAGTGLDTLTVTTASTTAVVYVHTTSTSTGSVTVTSGGTTTTIYLKGIAGSAYNVSLALPSNGGVGTTVKANTFVTDVFGNATTGSITLTAVNATVGSPTATATTGKYEFDLTFPATAGTVAVQANISASDVAGLAPAKKVASSFVLVSDKDATIAALNAALAKAEADLVAEKAARAADKVAAEKALADAKALADKALTEANAALAAATAQTLQLANTLAKLKVQYNKMAKKYRFKPLS